MSAISNNHHSVFRPGAAFIKAVTTALGIGLVAIMAPYTLHAQAASRAMEAPASSEAFTIPDNLLALQNLSLPAFKADTVRVENLGARPDGITLNTEPIQKAIDQLAGSGGGVVYVGPGQWLTGPLILKSGVNLHIAAGGLLQFSGDFDQYPLVTTSYEGLKAVRCQAPISASGATHIGITGKGIIDGAGDSWRMVKKDKLTASQWKDLLASGGVLDDKARIWYPSNGSLKGSKTKDAGVLKAGKTAKDYEDIKDYLRPNLLSLVSCKGVLLEGVTFQNSPAWCLHPLLCDQVIIRGIYAKNPWYAQNGDGLDLESCKDVLIEHSSFDVGDDGICMKSGRDEQGRKRGAPTENVLIQYCTVYHAHGGFVIGSEMSGGVRNVAIRRCSFLGTDIGLRFKTTRGRGGIVENIYATDINMNRIKGDAIRFNMYYAAKDPVPLNGEYREAPKEVMEPVTAATPQFRHFYNRRIHCNGADHSLFFRGLPEMAIKDIHLKNITMQTQKGIALIQADGIDVQNMRGIVTDPNAAFLSLSNTRHSSFTGLDLSRTKTGKHTTSDKKEAAVVLSGDASRDIRFKNTRLEGIPFNNATGGNGLQVQVVAGAAGTALRFE